MLNLIKILLFAALVVGGFGMTTVTTVYAMPLTPVIDTGGNSNPNGTKATTKSKSTSTTGCAQSNTNQQSFTLDCQDSSSQKHYCGDKDHTRVQTTIDFGCKGQGNALTDMTFAIIRFLSDGVGIVIVASIIVGGVQYSASGGDPNAAQAAIKRMRSSVGALLLFIFAYAILNYILPAGFLK